MNKTIKHSALYSALLAVTASAAPALSSAAEPTLALEEVVVTARRRDESLQDVPVAVTAFSAESLELRGAGDISELAQSVPSVTLEASRATNSTLTAFIRGVGQQDPLAGFEQGVALYIDDVYLARPQGALLDIYDVERIEVLRGPQGTLYGRNAVGGAIKYITKRLAEQPAARIKASLGNYGQQDLVATASAPLSDTVRVGATVASLQRDGYGRNLTTGDDNYNKDIVAYRLSAEYTPTEDILVRFAYDNTQDNSAPVAGHRPFAGASSGDAPLDDLRDTRAGAAGLDTTAGIGGENSIDAEGTQLSIEWQLNDQLTLKSITAYREDYTESVIDFDSLAAPDLDAPVIFDNDQLSQEFQLLYNSDKLNAVVGAYYLDAYAANDFDAVLGQLLGGITAYTGGEVETEAWSLFADVTYQLSEQLALSVGGRYTEDKRSADIYRASYLSIGSPAFGVDATPYAVSSDFEASRTYNDFSPRINVSYQLNDSTNVYAGFSQGFKAGSFDPRGANASTPSVERGFDPESLDSWEIGLKASWLDGRAITNVALFMSDYEDMQIPGSVGVDTDDDGTNDDFVGTVTNAGKAEIQGIEVEATLLVSEALTLQFSGNLLDASIEEWLVDDVNIASQRAVQNTPEKMAHLALLYTASVANGTMTTNLNWSYKSDIAQYESPVPVLDQKSYDTLNLSVVWTEGNGDWSFGVHGKNLTDEDIKTSGYCFGSGGCASALGLEDNTTVFYAPPRTVTATLNYNF